jgi:hypothetical protein
LIYPTGTELIELNKLGQKLMTPWIIYAENRQLNCFKLAANNQQGPNNNINN